MTANVQYIAEAYRPDTDDGVVKETEPMGRALALETANKWAGEGYEVDLVRRDWYSVNRIEYHVEATLLPR